MRELRGAGVVTVTYVPTDENTADLFTKILGRQPFEKHRKVVLKVALLGLGEIWLGGVIWGHIWVHPAKGLTVTGPLGRVDSEKGGFQSPIRSS